MSGAPRAKAAPVPLGDRSTAMWALFAALVANALLTLNVILAIGPIPPLLVLTVVLAAFALLWWFRARPWVFLAGGIALGLGLASNLPFIIQDPIKPIATDHAWQGILAIGVGLAGTIAGVMAFLEARRGAYVRVGQATRGEILAAGLVGLLAGAAYVSIMSFNEASTSGGAGIANGVQKAPAQTATLIADRSQFIEKTLHQIAGPMAIYLVNKDEGVHTFDIEVAGRHYSYPVAARSTTAVLLDVPDAGKYVFWCDIPGHRQSGMEGVLEVSKN
jgi:4-amino-4-deoxy-L-arabinose transferase-like glycosyltransferase